MADEPEAERLDTHEEEEGGPIKSFLEHLEDLRWVLIKCIAAAGVAMIACFFGGNYVMRILEWPLRQAPFQKVGKEQQLRILLGTNELHTFRIATNDPLASLVGTNQFSRLEIVPIVDGTNVSFGGKIIPESKPPGEKELPIPLVNLGPASAFVVATKVAFYG